MYTNTYQDTLLVHSAHHNLWPLFLTDTQPYPRLELRPLVIEASNLSMQLLYLVVVADPLVDLRLRGNLQPLSQCISLYRCLSQVDYGLVPLLQTA